MQFTHIDEEELCRHCGENAQDCLCDYDDRDSDDDEEY